MSSQSDPTGVAARACGRGLELSKADEELMEAARRKARALSQLDQADTLIRAARDELSMLEGPHYCTRFQNLGDIRSRLEHLAWQLRELNPPTGIFEL
jgi:hypothetical protein